MQRTPTCPSCCRNYGFKDVIKPVGPRIPLLLDCGHTFCEGCILKLARAKRTQVDCPECQQATTLAVQGEAGVVNIPANIYLLGILMSNKRAATISSFHRNRQSKPVSKGGMAHVTKRHTAGAGVNRILPNSGPVSDQTCEECLRAAASCKCVKCDCLYCADCFDKIHTSSNALRKHKPVPLAASCNSGGCSEHDNRPFEFYDQDESQPVCAHCVVMGERQNHKIVPIAQVTEDLQSNFSECLKEVRTVQEHLIMSEQRVCRALPTVRTEKSQLVNAVRQHFIRLSGIMQARELALVREVEQDNSGEDKLSELRQDIAHNMSEAKRFIQEVEALQGNPSKLMSTAKQLSAQFESMKETRCCTVPVKSAEKKPKFTATDDLSSAITSHGSLSGDISTMFVFKKLSEVEEGDFVDDFELPPIVPPPSDLDDATETASTSSETSEPSAANTRTGAAARLLQIPYQHELVRVTHIRDPCHFMVQRQADQERLLMMMNAINIQCDRSNDVSELVSRAHIGDVCCAQFTMDNKWYRARVVTAFSPAHPQVEPTLDNGLCVELVYIDYGNSEWLPLGRLRKLREEFHQVPELAQYCSLTDVVPPFQETTWPSKAVKAFGSLAGDKPLLMTVLNKRGGQLYVDLKRPEDDEPTQDDDRPASVRDALVFLEVARFVSPVSKPNGLPSFPKRSYKLPTPIAPGGFVDVTVTHITGPDEVYLRRMNGEENLELDHIMKEMAKMYSSRKRGTEWRVPWPYKGLVCAARFSEDKVWYRAVVTGVNSDETVEVSYVDFGNSEKLAFAEVRKLPDMFLRLPKQAMVASLAGVKPRNNETDWSNQIRASTADLLFNRTLVVEVKSNEAGKMGVLLFDTSGKRDVCINAFLVQHGYAEDTGDGQISSPPTETKKGGATTEANKTTVEEDARTEDTADPKSPEVIEEIEPAPVGTGDDSASGQRAQAEQAADVTGQEPEASQGETLPKFKAAVMPETETFKAGVTFVDADGVIYAQEVKEGDRTLIDVMTALMDKYSQGGKAEKAPPSATCLQPGLPCCARYEYDNMWYRATVVSAVDADNVKVNYIDFGNSEVVSLSSLRLEMPFLEVPRQCLRSVLQGVQPCTPDKRWSPEAVTALTHLVVGEDCVMEIKGQKSAAQPLPVRMSLLDGTDVAQALFKQGLVQMPYAVIQERQAAPMKTEPSPIQLTPPRRPNTGSSRVSPETRAHVLHISSREAENLMQLPPNELPKMGIGFDVTVTHIDEPNFVYLQRVTPSSVDPALSQDPDPTLTIAELYLTELEELAGKINQPKYFSKLAPLSSASEGMLCCGRYTQDNMWYRAQVISVLSEDPLEVRVVYVDYGTSEVIQSDRLRGFPSELLELPVQSTRCLVEDVVPPEASEGPFIEDTAWPVSTMDSLVKLVAGKKLIAKIVSYGPPLGVILYDRRIGSDGTPEDVSIARLMSEQELANGKEPESPAVEPDSAKQLLKPSEFESTVDSSSAQPEQSTAEVPTTDETERTPEVTSDAQTGKEKVNKHASESCV